MSAAPEKSNSEQSIRISRRNFNRTAAFGAASSMFGFNMLPSGARGALERPALAGIGAGGKGRTDIQESRKVGFEIAALVDVIDTPKLKSVEGRLKSMAQVRDEFPAAKFFTDYRQMLSDMGDRIDAVTVSTPDHHHFHASIMAMQAGKHVYCQKPLTHGIWEARMMTQVARQTGVKTQMGNQAHANDHMRRCIELIRAGVIGKVKEIHAWTNRPIWPQGFAAAPAAEPIPAGIDWEQWIGPAPAVEYSSKIAPFNWRGWWNYGTGALGDMACHIMDIGYWTMMPGAPVAVTAQQQGATKLSPPVNSRITWEFAPGPHSSKDGFRFHWYDGYINAKFNPDKWQLDKDGDDYNHPDEAMLNGMDFKKFGSVIVGEEGKMFFNRSNRNWVLQSSSHVDGFHWPAESLPRAAGQNNYQEWLDAINGKIEQSESSFALAGPMTETILLGVLAQRVPETRLEWQADAMEVKGRPELKEYIQRPYRDGWKSPV